MCVCVCACVCVCVCVCVCGGVRVSQHTLFGLKGVCDRVKEGIWGDRRVLVLVRAIELGRR